MPTGCLTPVHFELGGAWTQSAGYATRDELLGDLEFAVKQVSIARAKALSKGAPIDEEGCAGYQYYEKAGGTILLYRTPAGVDSSIEYFDKIWFDSERTQIPAPSEAAPFTFSPITEARARQLEPSAFSSPAPQPTRYFWWDTDTDVSPYLLRVNPDNSVDYYVEPEHRNSQRRFRHADASGWVIGQFEYSSETIANTTEEISEATARSRRPAAFNTDYSRNLSPGPDAVRYFVNEFDLYRLTGTDTFHYWSWMNLRWAAPVTPGSVIVGYKEVTPQQAKDFMPKAEIAGATATAELLADFSIPGTEETLAIKTEFVDGKLHISVYEIQ